MSEKSPILNVRMRESLPEPLGKETSADFRCFFRRRSFPSGDDAAVIRGENHAQLRAQNAEGATRRWRKNEMVHLFRTFSPFSTLVFDARGPLHPSGCLASDTEMSAKPCGRRACARRSLRRRSWPSFCEIPDDSKRSRNTSHTRTAWQRNLGGFQVLFSEARFSARRCWGRDAGREPCAFCYLHLLQPQQPQPPPPGSYLHLFCLRHSFLPFNDFFFRFESSEICKKCYTERRRTAKKQNMLHGWQS